MAYGFQQILKKQYSYQGAFMVLPDALKCDLVIKSRLIDSDQL